MRPPSSPPRHLDDPRPSSGGSLAACTRPSEKTPTPSRWNTASGSVGGICLRTALSKDGVWVSHLCALAGGSSALARGKRGNQPEHEQSYCPDNFLSHEVRPVLIDRDENMLAVPVCPISSVVMPISITVMMPVWMVPVIFRYYYGCSFSSGCSPDYRPANHQGKKQCLHNSVAPGQEMHSRPGAQNPSKQLRRCIPHGRRPLTYGSLDAPGTRELRWRSEDVGRKP
jgi:hypothetical protein